MSQNKYIGQSTEDVFREKGEGKRNITAGGRSSREGGLCT